MTVEDDVRSIRESACKRGWVLHYRPWLLPRNGCKWFFGDLDRSRGGDAPAYRVFSVDEERLRRFDEACEYLLRSVSLRFVGPALPSGEGKIYEVLDVEVT